MLGFVDDGQTITRFIQGEDRVFNSMRVTYRPVPMIDHSAVDKRVREYNRRDRTRDSERLIYQTIVERIVDWEFLDKDGNVIGEEVKPTIENVIRAPGPLLDRLIMIIYGQRDGGDVDPFASEANGTDTSSAYEKSEENLGN